MTNLLIHSEDESVTSIHSPFLRLLNHIIFGPGDFEDIRCLRQKELQFQALEQINDKRESTRV